MHIHRYYYFFCIVKNLFIAEVDKLLSGSVCPDFFNQSDIWCHLLIFDIQNSHKQRHIWQKTKIITRLVCVMRRQMHRLYYNTSTVSHQHLASPYSLINTHLLGVCTACVGYTGGCDHSPPGGCSTPCTRGFWTHPSKLPPLWGRFVARETSDPRCKVYEHARCGRCEHKAGPQRCRHTATPGLKHDRYKRKEEMITHWQCSVVVWH